MVFTNKKKRKATVRNRGGDEDGVRKAEAEEVQTEMNREKPAVLNKEVEKKNIEGVGTEKGEELKTKKT